MASIKKNALAINYTLDLTALSTEAFVNYQRSELQATSHKLRRFSEEPSELQAASKATSCKPQASSDPPSNKR